MHQIDVDMTFTQMTDKKVVKMQSEKSIADM